MNKQTIYRIPHPHENVKDVKKVMSSQVSLISHFQPLDKVKIIFARNF